MGMFDSLYVDCPQCGKPIEFQSKVGDCACDDFDITNVPAEIALDCKDDIEQCPNCFAEVGLNVQSIVIIQAYNLTPV
jgi:hypothetical protein